MSEVTDLIDELRAGTKTLDEVAQRFRERAWPERPRSIDPEDAFRRTEEDPEPFVEGSFDEVAGARARGKISSEEYKILKSATEEGARARRADE